ncbi:MAG: hypothetical protein MI747_24485 [Desulfobacterales bacterium]|nr:hypothetical protein [Desulfobacterales bacterium]
MKRFICLCLVLILSGLYIPLPGPVEVQANPFTSKDQPSPPALGQTKGKAGPAFIQKLIFKQHQLRQTIATQMRRAKEEKSLFPIAAALMAALAYGVLHSAGPGHGKAVALSYILSRRPGYLRGLAFGNILAFTHGISGIAFVLLVKWFLKTGFNNSLEQITLHTQRISFSLILLLGIFLLHRMIKKKGDQSRESASQTPSPKTNPPHLGTAVIMGLVPCPGVVMVMLFSLSMGATALGILMGLAISLGMAATISLVTLAGILGKNSLISGASRFTALAKWTEILLEGMAALALIILGSLFLLTTF